MQWERQVGFNQNTRSLWHEYSNHRLRTTELIVRSKPADADCTTLCVLGAGNCNDLDLQSLCTHFDEISLVDIDRDAVGFALEHQAPLPSTIRVVCADLSGEVDQEIRYSVVFSGCVLSQLVQEQVEKTGDTEESLRVREKHLKDGIRLTQIGGTFVLISDFVSSDTAPEICTAPAFRLPEVTEHLVRARNFFTGMNPYAVERYIQMNDFVRRSVEQVGRRKIWRWSLGARSFLVAGWTLRRVRELAET